VVVNRDTIIVRNTRRVQGKAGLTITKLVKRQHSLEKLAAFFLLVVWLW
jgi:hypothetical protein